MEKIKINREKGEVVLRFNYLFYPPDLVRIAVDDFRRFCDHINLEDHSVVLCPKQKEDLDIIGYEFYNYVLGLIKNN